MVYVEPLLIDVQLICLKIQRLFNSCLLPRILIFFLDQHLLQFRSGLAAEKTKIMKLLELFFLYGAGLRTGHEKDFLYEEKCGPQ